MSKNKPGRGRQPPHEATTEGSQPSESDSQAWKDAFSQAENGLRRFLSSKLPQPADVDDCLQAISIAMLNNGTPIPDAARKAWLFRVAANEAALWWRKKARTDRMIDSAAVAESSPGYATESPPSQQIEDNEAREKIHQAIERLPSNQRDVVRLRIRDGKSFREIADHLEIPLGTALTRMRLAMDQLRIDLHDFHSDT
ncbi:RNA polymerase sigma factor [Stieleria sp. JC731]|uniref:RNA polymerase sigma factor n=1 Tax=Pirellulaceae TaxID=2691357 RepID=UPI001E3CC01D|nr:RNA polymerase sigma factor [Stieleria sp. JC731]MCC9599575.1 RNA polymerase sigma factor [Stieleria sp. JC731]